MILWTLVLCATAAWVRAPPPPPLECKTDNECDTNYYCRRDVHDAYSCLPCLDCKQLKREPQPPTPDHCIKSVADCGPCISGLVEDFRGESACVPPDSRGDSAALPVYAWVIITIGVGLLFFVLVVFIFIQLFRNTETLKILTSTASVQPSCSAGAASGEAVVAASAPDPPPPYRAHYTAVRPSSPPPPLSPEPPVHYYNAQHNGEGPDSSWPFLERKSSEFGEWSGAAREAAGNQAARVYNNPHYVRGAPIPPSFEGAGGVGDAVGADAESVADADDERDAFAMDDVTVASTWTPDARDGDNGNVPSAGGLSAQLEAARGTALVRAPPPPHPHPLPHHASPACGWQDSNNNRNASEPLGAPAGGASGAGSQAPSFFINVVQTINTVQQPPRNETC